MLRRHFFLAGAVVLVLLMAVLGGLRLLTPKGGDPKGGAAAAQTKGGRGGAGGGGGGARAAQVSATQAMTRTFTDRIDVIGVAKARQSVTLTSDNTELVTGIHFVSGQYVPKGYVLATLKSDEQVADVTNAKAAVEKARKDNERWQELGRRGYAPRAQLDQYAAALAQAQANLQSAQARLRDRTIRAPFSGSIGLSDAAPGMLITPGTPIATLDDTSVIIVDFDIPERFLGTVGPGTPIEARADAFGDQVFAGRISKVDTRVKADTRAVTARAEFANPGGRLKPGMLVKVGVQQGLRTSVAAPEAAVQFEGDQPFVFTIVTQGGKTVAVQKTVVAGAREAGFIEIRDGLAPGEKIVADGLNRLQPNQPVKVVTRGAGGGRGGAGAPGGGVAAGAAPVAGKPSR